MLSALLRQEVKVTEKRTEQARQPEGGGRLYAVVWWLSLVSLVIVTSLLRYYQIGDPPAVTWDEYHFLRFSQHYLNGTYFQDVHPPLGKMIIGGIGYLAGQNRTQLVNVKHVYQYPYDQWYIFMRMGVATFGILQVITSFLTVWEISRSLSAAFMTAVLIVCDPAAHALNRLVILDPILLWFILLSTFCGVKFASQRHNPFGLRWWLWMTATGVALGLTMAVKYVGAFVVALIGVQAVYDLWEQYCDLTASLWNLVKHVLARCVGLILVPLLLYLATFALHLQILDKGSTMPGIGLGSAQFRLSFPDNVIGQRTPPVVMYGAQVTILSTVPAIGYLTTSYDLYPPEFTAEHQILSFDMNMDELNAWAFKHADDEDIVDLRSPDYVPEPVMHGDLVRLLNVFTERHLQTHRLPAAITKHMYMACGYGEIGEFPEGGVWRVLVDDPSAEPGVTPLSAIHPGFRLISNRTGCALRPGISKYPEWGYHAWEAACDPKGLNLNDPSQVFQIDENVNPRIPAENLKERFQLSTIQRIIEMHRVMFASNQRLTFYEFEGEEGIQKHLSSRPWMWPVLYRGCPGHASDMHSLYFVGSPQVYFLNLAVLGLLPVLAVSYAYRRARQTTQTEPSRLVEGVVFLATGWALHYLPFWAMGRILYFHHYLPAFFFSTMITGLLTDAAIGRLEGFLRPGLRGFVRPTVVAAFTAFYVNSFITNWALAFGLVTVDDEAHPETIKDHFYFDSWLL
ncbi:Protein O-mannosyl-transferase 2 [Amphibalanus amphitrite]|uniref:Protein O-mannosyl-transferase 2 n=1 Tax=Amphibalanus amphitrite TaxID=1232801 RepID=A0A6A4V7L6_AMPAM|nr:Protein O-mannosyl-transferase 2 [Amphibalanus amphitrite]